MRMGRLTQITMAALLVAASASAVTITDAQRLKDTDGKTLALLLVCNACKAPAAESSAKCPPGVPKGYFGGQPCGDCLMKSNWGKRIGYPYDVFITGTINGPDGKPLDSQFVRLLLPNGWSVMSRTTKEGKFRLALGATEERRSKTPLTKDLGTFTFEHTTGKDNAFAIFMLPEKFKPCGPEKK
jgi:hypothetical protein